MTAVSQKIWPVFQPVWLISPTLTFVPNNVIDKDLSVLAG